ncbi:MAG: hypothetical protein WA705_21860 [Candidatus Ozemobacteraceae bacterium]
MGVAGKTNPENHLEKAIIRFFLSETSINRTFTHQQIFLARFLRLSGKPKTNRRKKE